MAMMQVIVQILLCLQASLALHVGNFPQSTYPVLFRAHLPIDISADIYARIISRYDIVTMPSVTDDRTLRMAMEKLSCSYDLYISNTIYMEDLIEPERLGIAYRRDVVSLSDFIRHQPTGLLSMRAKINFSGQEFILAIPHLPGADTLQLLELLPSAYDTLISIYNLENVLFSGDFNTFDRFVTRAENDALTVSRNATFQWFISYDENTFTVPPMFLNGAAARFLTAGDISAWVVPGSARVFNTQTYFNMTTEEASGLVLFYPVELELIEPIDRSN